MPAPTAADTFTEELDDAGVEVSVDVADTDALVKFEIEMDVRVNEK